MMIDVLWISWVLCAGAGKYGMKLTDIKPEDWEWHMSLNVSAVLYLTQLAAPLLEAGLFPPAKYVAFKDHFLPTVSSYSYFRSKTFSASLDNTD